MQPFLALITPIGGGTPDQGLPAPGGGVPSHPIYNPPYPSTGPGFPSYPIAPGGPPLGIWGPGSPIIGNPIAPGGPIGTVPPPQINIPVFPGQLPMPGGPGGGGGEAPDQSLPGAQPGVSPLPSGSFILVWSPIYGWILVAQGGTSGSSGGARPDQSLPGSQPEAGQGLPQPEKQPKK